MNARPLIDNRMLDQLTGFLASTVTIQENSTPTRGTSGQSKPGWSDLAGHTDLACGLSSLAKGGGGRSYESRTGTMTLAVNQRICLLLGSYPTITTHMRAVAASTNYNILSVEQDSQGQMTRLLLEVVTP